jgi:hypothetical protein
VAVYNSSVFHNFGQRPFTYTPPTGYSALSSANLPAPAITDGKEHFKTLLYTGNGATQAVQGLEFQPDFVWIKNRSAALHHVLSDAVRGANNALFSSTNIAEFNSTLNVTAFNSNGFTVGNGTNTNGTGNAIVAWNWNAGGSTVTNNDGARTAQVRANPDAGFSIVTYNPGLSSGQSTTVGHGLNQAPEFIITKSRSGVFNWWVFTTIIDGSVDYFSLNTGNPKINDSYSLALTDTTFTQHYVYTGNSTSHVAYCFHSVDGFSKFGTYTGNGSANGPFVYTGFRPAFVMIKRFDIGTNWNIIDTTRGAYNIVTPYIDANTSAAEGSYPGWDIVSNGFKLRNTGSSLNASSGGYLYMAFAENPFKTARAR